MPASQPDAQVPTSAPAWKSGFTHYVTTETALIRRGNSDGDVIYDTVSVGLRVRMADVRIPPVSKRMNYEYAHVITEDGRDGLIIPERLKALIMPIAKADVPAFMTPIVHDPLATIQVTRPLHSLLTRTRSTQQASAAIEKAAHYLESVQRPDGTWDRPGMMGHSRTALVAGTLFAAVGPDFQGLSRARALLSDEPDAETSTLAFRDQILDRRHSTEATSSGAATLLNVVAARQPGFSSTFFGHTIGADFEDPINSYYGLRAIFNGEQNGIEVPSNFWKRSDTQWREEQAKDGGWPSGRFNKSAASDFRGTAAGFLALAITSERLFHDEPRHFEKSTGNYLDSHQQAAATWLNQHMPEVWNDILHDETKRPCETLWWLDQVMTEAGAIRIDRRDSVTQMIQWLLEEQKPDGSWAGDPAETAFAIRVLSNHLRPPGMAKLAYDSGHWNQRPSDIRHVSRWLGQHLFGMPATRWLIVDIDDPMEDFTALPILYIAGDSDLQFTPVQEDKLRRFVEQGGLIVGNADQGSAKFSKAFKALGGALFPRYEFRSLSKTHPIFPGRQLPAKKAWESKIRLVGLSNGIRELMLLIPEADASLKWQNDQTAKHADAFEMLGNIMLYTVGRGPVNFAREFPMPLPPGNILSHRLTVARLHVGDNWNPEPAAWRHMDDDMQTQDGVWVATRESQLQPGSLDHCKLAHLTGTSRFILTPAQRRELHGFVSDGGTLLIDAAGGSAEFADAADAEMRAVFGNDALQLADPMSPAILFAKRDGVAPLAGQPGLYRRQVQLAPGDAGRTPRLRVMKLANRMAVFFSREDLTAAMAGVESDNIHGYLPQAGVNLVRNILLYVEKNP